MDRKEQAIANTNKVARRIRRAGFKCDVEIIESGVIAWGKIIVWLEDFVIAFVEVGDMNTITTSDMVFKTYEFDIERGFFDSFFCYYLHEYGDVKWLRKIAYDVQKLGTERILFDTGDKWRLSGE